PKKPARGEKKNEDQAGRRSVDRVAFDGRGNGCIGARGNASGEGQGAAVSRIHEEGGSRSDEGTVGSTMELQVGTRPLVRGAGDGTHRRGRGLLADFGEREGDDCAGRGAGP